jgi:hypothetical protein
MAETARQKRIPRAQHRTIAGRSKMAKRKLKDTLGLH